MIECVNVYRVAIILRTSSSSVYFNEKGKLDLFVSQLEMLDCRVIMLNK